MTCGHEMGNASKPKEKKTQFQELGKKCIIFHVGYNGLEIGRKSLSFVCMKKWFVFSKPPYIFEIQLHPLVLYKPLQCKVANFKPRNDLISVWRCDGLARLKLLASREERNAFIFRVSPIQTADIPLAIAENPLQPYGPSPLYKYTSTVRTYTRLSWIRVIIMDCSRCKYRDLQFGSSDKAQSREQNCVRVWLTFWP